jgi:Flp pilus assembly protein TadG
MFTGRSRHRSRGQSLVEFALVAPVMIAMIAAVIQFGILFWAQNTLTQLVRETGRWAATQSCTADVAGQETSISQNGTYALMGTRKSITVLYWDAATKPPPYATPTPCPPKDNTKVNYVSVTVVQTVQTFFPGMQYLPLLGTCDGSGCHVDLSSTAQFRLEPKP